MTQFFEVVSDCRYSKYLDHGFVGLVETMGSDATIAQSARVSYGKNLSKKESLLKRVTNFLLFKELKKEIEEHNTKLIRYLMRHQHTSPFEMGELRFHLKIPIFVMRQHIRHRTWSTSEYSGRYSVMSKEFFMPDVDRNLGQSSFNKQQSEGQVNTDSQIEFLRNLKDCYDFTYSAYSSALNSGISKEVARIVLPVANYTELYAKVDLHNFFHYIKLRLDSRHAQAEIVELAKLMYDKVKKHFPISCQAFEDYQLNSITFSPIEIEALRGLLDSELIQEISEKIGPLIGTSRLNLSEQSELKQKLSVINKEI